MNTETGTYHDILVCYVLSTNMEKRGMRPSCERRSGQGKDESASIKIKGKKKNKGIFPRNKDTFVFAG